MSTDVAALADHHALVALTHTYCWALDGHDWERLRHEVFLADATAALTDELSGIDAIIGRVSSALGKLDASQHMVSTHEITIDGDRATGRCYLHAQHVRRDAEGGPNYIVAGTYHDRYVRTPAGWRIERRELHVMWTEGNLNVVRPPKVG
jgi:hypothetical protein